MTATRPLPLTALCAAHDIVRDGEVEGGVQWLHLLPAGEVRTHDGRGPYMVKDMAALMAASLPAGGKLVVDENHSTDLLAPKGGAAPARGWIVELQARADGLWGRVEWTGEGRKIIDDMAYRGISPVIAHRKDGVITAILRASLINTPNLVGLTALHSEEDILAEENRMDYKQKLLALLGLEDGADDAAIDAAIAARKDRTEVAAQSQAGQAQAVQGALESAAVVALQGELASVTTQLNALNDKVRRDQAVAFVDGAIAAGRVGVKPMRDDYIALHMEDVTRAEKLIGGLPAITGSSHATQVVAETSADGLTSADRQVMALMGIDEIAYKAAQAADGQHKGIL